jgi:hypothetical protein
LFVKMSEQQAFAATDWTVDPVFTYHRAGRLDGAYGPDPASAWRHLSALVARDPLDLEAQVRRVMLSCRPEHSGRAFGALLDLFLALGPHGQSLRHRMLQLAAPCIEFDERRFLEAHLESGLARNATLPAGTGALLDTAVIGSAHAVRHERAAVQATSRVEEAISLLDEGDLPGARALLEEAVLDDPSDPTAVQELLGIYHHSRDSEGKSAMQARLQERHRSLPPTWA